MYLFKFYCNTVILWRVKSFEKGEKKKGEKEKNSQDSPEDSLISQVSSEISSQAFER